MKYCWKAVSVVRELLERLVDRGDVGEDDEQLAGRDLPVQRLVGADAEHRRGAGRGDQLDRELERGLADGELDARVDRRLRPACGSVVYSCFSRPNARMTRIIDIASWTIAMFIALQAADAVEPRLDAVA